MSNRVCKKFAIHIINSTNIQSVLLKWGEKKSSNQEDTIPKDPIVLSKRTVNIGKPFPSYLASTK